jgi:hypothetical protein
VRPTEPVSTTILYILHNWYYVQNHVKFGSNPTAPKINTHSITAIYDIRQEFIHPSFFESLYRIASYYTAIEDRSM